MYYIKLYEQFLFEIGDSSIEPYSYRQVKSDRPSTTLYSFKGKGNLTYMVYLLIPNLDLIDDIPPQLKNRKVLWISFITQEKGDSEVNQGDMYKVMSTVIKITKEYLESNSHIDAIAFEGRKNFSGKIKDYELKTPSIRSKLYKQYAQKNIGPQWEIQDSPSYNESLIILIKKK